MITSPTVLVLGAGASQPYGYPLGFGLKEKIILNQLNDSSVQIYVQLGFKPDDVYVFKNELHRSPLTSVDAFLEQRPEFTKMGKIAIAKELIQYEEENNILTKFDWYQYLFNKMNVRFEDFENNRIAFITFNYDRSFEHFLMMSLKSTYGKTENECAKVLSKIPFIHVHGKLGSLPWEKVKSFTRDYSTLWDLNSLLQTSEQIRIVHEEDPKRDAIFSKAFELLTMAERIYFLGFGFGELNVKRLRIGELNQNGKEIKATAYQLENAEQEEVRALTGAKVELGHNSYSAYQFLRTYGHFRN